MSDDSAVTSTVALLRDALEDSARAHEVDAARHLERAASLESGTEAYAHHRALAFVHQWCFLLEQPLDDPAPLRELVAEPVRFRLSNGSELTDFAQIAAWHDTAAHAMVVATHTVIGWQVVQAESARYDVTLDFAWQGISPQGQPMTARTHHEWSLVEDGRRLPRLTSFVPTLVQPFSPASAGDALAALRSSQAIAVS